jgi:hypothetical protein
MIWKYKHRLRHGFAVDVHLFSRVIKHSDIFITSRHSAVNTCSPSCAATPVQSPNIDNEYIFFFIKSSGARELCFVYLQYIETPL